jgi:F-type H+-transporting ATPase subunit a
MFKYFLVTFISLLVLLLVGGVEMLGYIPYTITIGSDFKFILFLALLFFLLTITWHSVSERLTKYFSPSNTNTLLSYLLIPVELVRTSIRPITLALRITANITFGMYLLIIVYLYFHYRYNEMIIMTLVMRYEALVLLVQVYVFTLLLVIWYDEWDIFYN